MCSEALGSRSLIHAISRKTPPCGLPRPSRTTVTGNREYNPAWHTALDLRNLLTISEAIARAAIERRESRGGHFRDDYPDKDPAAAKYNIVIRSAPDGSMQLTREPIPPLPDALQQIISEEK
ncbi:MAG: hypothetical protein ABIT38_19850 [Gemmatimonadaceae bacterium]